MQPSVKGQEHEICTYCGGYGHKASHCEEFKSHNTLMKKAAAVATAKLSDVSRGSRIEIANKANELRLASFRSIEQYASYRVSPGDVAAVLQAYDTVIKEKETVK